MDEPWDILWFGAFETTAFMTAVLVGLFSFIPDPTGKQDVKDASEIKVFVQWRRAVILVFLSVLLMVIVLVLQVVNKRQPEVTIWTLALMAAPWAPFLHNVVAAVMAWGSVKSLMRNRVARNEISCVMREYLWMGHQSISTAKVVLLVSGEHFNRPAEVLRDVVAATARSTSHSAEYHQRVVDLQNDVDRVGAAWPVTRRALQHGPDSETNGSDQRRLTWRRFDLWTRWWTGSVETLEADPFPPGRLSRPVAGATAAPQGEGDGPRLSVSMVRLQRAFVLDKIDDCHRGHTLSSARQEESLPNDLCSRCKLAIRGAIETFLESSNRAHINVCARSWLDKMDVDWHGRMDIIVDGMWEATFVDHAALLVDTAEHEEPPSTGADGKPPPHPIATTRKFLLFLFLVARSLLGSCQPLEGVGRRVQRRIHSVEWWTDYWQAVVRELGYSRDSGDVRDDWLDGIKDKVLREVTIAEMKAVVRLLAEKPVRPHAATDVEGKELSFGSFCGKTGCFLNERTRVAVKPPAY